jgi:hypothetical protein
MDAEAVMLFPLPLPLSDNADAYILTDRNDAFCSAIMDIQAQRKPPMKCIQWNQMAARNARLSWKTAWIAARILPIKTLGPIRLGHIALVRGGLLLELKSGDVELVASMPRTCPTSARESLSLA